MPFTPLLFALLSSHPIDEPAVLQANSIKAFAHDLVVELPSRGGSNFVGSPYSVSQCLALLLPGLGRSDAALVAKGLHAQGEGSYDGSQVQALNRQLAASPNSELVVANSIWAGPRYAFTSTYKNTVEQMFGAGAFTLPSTDGAGVTAVNQWVSDKTQHRIQNLLQQLDSSTSAVLVNALSFDAKWQHPFRPGQTAKRVFYGRHGAMQIPMMATTAVFDHAAGPGYQALQVGYAGHSYAMVLFLPDGPKDPLSLLRSIDFANLPTFESAYTDLQMPRFKFETRFDMLGTLAKLGMGKLAVHFDAKPMLGTGQPMVISQMIHAAEIDVDENGTRATAATAIGMMPTAIRQYPDPIHFHVDHPFAFAIVHASTMTPVFVGAVYSPATK